MRKLVSVLLVVLGSFSLQASESKSEAQVAFGKLSGLVGEWRQKDRPESTLGISFSLIAGDSVVVETWSSSGVPYSLTLYHLDGDNLVATHYCPQGNQPRLKMVLNGEGKSIDFKFWDATNLIDPNKSHQVALGFDFTGNSNELIRREAYRENGVDDPSQLHLVKVQR